MKLRDAIRYYELTGSDVLSDVKNQNEYLEYLANDFDLPNDFTDVLEVVEQNLLVLWADSHDIENEESIPSTEELFSLYLTGIHRDENSSHNTTKIVEAPSPFKKRKKKNQTLDLIVSIVNSDIDLAQFYELEIELVIDIMNKVGKKREQESKKSKKKGGVKQ